MGDSNSQVECIYDFPTGLRDGGAPVVPGTPNVHDAGIFSIGAKPLECSFTFHMNLREAVGGLDNVLYFQFFVTPLTAPAVANIESQYLSITEYNGDNNMAQTGRPEWLNSATSQPIV